MTGWRKVAVTLLTGFLGGCATPPAFGCTPPAGPVPERHEVRIPVYAGEVYAGAEEWLGWSRPDVVKVCPMVGSVPPELVPPGYDECDPEQIDALFGVDLSAYPDGAIVQFIADGTFEYYFDGGGHCLGLVGRTGPDEILAEFDPIGGSWYSPPNNLVVDECVSGVLGDGNPNPRTVHIESAAVPLPADDIVMLRTIYHDHPSSSSFRLTGQPELVVRW